MPADCTEMLTGLFREILGENLVGLYLHGSAVLGGFCWETSDIDLLGVVETVPTREQRLRLVEVLAACSNVPGKGLEMSLVQKKHCAPFVYPTPYCLHWSEGWRERYKVDPAQLLFEEERTDRDLAAHFTVVRACGKLLWGPSAEEILGSVPRIAYLAALQYDANEYPRELSGNPVYVCLNACRILAYLEEGRILSKVAGGEWGLTHLPESCRPLLTACLSACRGEGGAVDAAAGG